MVHSIYIRSRHCQVRLAVAVEVANSPTRLDDNSCGVVHMRLEGAIAVAQQHTHSVIVFVTAKSALPSPLKSPTASE